MFLCVEDISFTSFFVFVCWGYQFYIFLCICVLMISSLPFSMYLCVEDIRYIERGKTDILNTQVIERCKTDILNTQIHLFLCICVLRISVLPLSMYLCVGDIGFTSFYVFVCWGYQFYIFLCICVLMISGLPIQRGKTDTVSTHIHRKR
jgi:hypothetical protein